MSSKTCMCQMKSTRHTDIVEQVFARASICNTLLAPPVEINTDASVHAAFEDFCASLWRLDYPLHSPKFTIYNGAQEARDFDCIIMFENSLVDALVPYVTDARTIVLILPNFF